MALRQQGWWSSYSCFWWADVALASCCSVVGHRWVDRVAGSHSLSGSHRLGSAPFSACLYQHGLAANCVTQTRYLNGGTWETCVPQMPQAVLTISSFNKRVSSCFSDRNHQLWSRQNSAFIHTLNIGLSHMDKIACAWLKIDKIIGKCVPWKTWGTSGNSMRQGSMLQSTCFCSRKRCTIKFLMPKGLFFFLCCYQKKYFKICLWVWWFHCRDTGIFKGN